MVSPENCSATVDFNVPGKPNPPPVNLAATIWTAAAPSLPSKAVLEFTDPSGKLAAAGFPLNQWLQLNATGEKEAPACPQSLKAVFADMHDGDKKEVTVEGSRMTIRPSGNNQTWVVHAAFDGEKCAASVDFNVPGKPSPPPKALLLTLWSLSSGGAMKSSFEFTDPEGKLAPASVPLNAWVQLPEQKALMI